MSVTLKINILRSVMVSLAILLTGTSCVSHHQTQFQGWKNTYHLQNEKVQADIVPQIGRLVSFRTLSGQNVLESRNCGSVPPADSRDLFFVGGLYTLIAPQIHWVPFNGTYYPVADPVLDRGPFRVTHCTPTELTMISPVSSLYGLQIEKTFRLASGQPRMEYIVTFHNAGPYPIRWAVWNTTAVKPIGVIFFDVPNGKSDIKPLLTRFEEQDKYLSHVTQLVDADTAAYDLRKYDYKGAKLGVAPGSDYLAYRQPTSWFIRRFHVDLKNCVYTDWHSQIEIWADAQEDHIFELEVVSPDYVIPAGKSVSWSETFFVADDNSPIADNLTQEAQKIPAFLKTIPRKSLLTEK